MCTVTFLPLNKGYIITSNRDESPLRAAALRPELYTVHSVPAYFPKDPKAGGTWIAASEHHTLCLLNGAFKRHISEPPYRLSRGLMLLDFFKYNSAKDFASQYDFKGIENFTLLIIDHSDALALTELRWDGTQLSISEKDVSKSHIWSSSTLYTDEVIRERMSWFDVWQKDNKEYKQESIVHFHRFGGKGDRSNDIVMNREDKVKTVSITSVIRTSAGSSIYYSDLAEDTIHDIFDKALS
jgi:hypothetical protein